MDENKVKKQHFVSQSYLRRFTFNDKQVYVFDKKTRKVFISYIEDIAFKKYYYDIPKIALPEGVDNQIVEKKILRYVDSKSKYLIDELINGIEKNGEFNNELKNELSPFICMQIFRTSSFRDGYVKSVENVIKNEALEYFKNKDVNISSDDFNIKYNQTLATLYITRLMCTPEILYKLAFILKNYIWLISYNDTSLSYWTSDNPITFKKYKNKFFKSPFKYWPDVHEVAYPLNPKYLLVMLERTNFRQWETFDCRKIDSKYDNVIHYNSRYIDYFCRLIISRDNNFELANKWCEENPEAASRFETFSSKASI